MWPMERVAAGRQPDSAMARDVRSSTLRPEGDSSARKLRAIYFFVNPDRKRIPN